MYGIVKQDCNEWDSTWTEIHFPTGLFEKIVEVENKDRLGEFLIAYNLIPP